MLADERERIALVIRHHEVRLRSLDLQLAPPVNLLHLVHPLEAEDNAPLTLDPAIDQPSAQAFQALAVAAAQVSVQLGASAPACRDTENIGVLGGPIGRARAT